MKSAIKLSLAALVATGLLVVGCGGGDNSSKDRGGGGGSGGLGSTEIKLADLMNVFPDWTPMKEGISNSDVRIRHTLSYNRAVDLNKTYASHPKFIFFDDSYDPDKDNYIYIYYKDVANVEGDFQTIYTQVSMSRTNPSENYIGYFLNAEHFIKYSDFDDHFLMLEEPIEDIEMHMEYPDELDMSGKFASYYEAVKNKDDFANANCETEDDMSGVLVQWSCDYNPSGSTYRIHWSGYNHSTRVAADWVYSK